MENFEIFFLKLIVSAISYQKLIKVLKYEIQNFYFFYLSKKLYFYT